MLLEWEVLIEEGDVVSSWTKDLDGWGGSIGLPCRITELRAPSGKYRSIDES